MNENSNQQQESNQAHHESTAEGAGDHSQKPPVIETCVFDRIRAAFERGAEDAKKAAEEAAPKIKSAATDAAYWTSYGISFAAVFPWTLARELAPQAVKSGCSNGAKDGKDAAEKFVNEIRRQGEEQTTPSPGPNLQPDASHPV